MKLLSCRRARECALQVLYSWELSHNNVIDIASYVMEEQNMMNVNLIYFRELYCGVIANVVILDKLMMPYLSRKLIELGYVERSVLRIALFELSQCLYVPYKVVINEAIELAKIFGAEKSHKFINGVLNKAAPLVRPNKK